MAPSIAGCGLRGEATCDVPDAQGTEVAFAVTAERRGSRVGLAVTDHQHVRDLGQLGVADLAPDRLAAVVDAGAQAGVAELRRDLARVVEMAVRDGQDERLERREPEGELARVV